MEEFEITRREFIDRLKKISSETSSIIKAGVLSQRALPEIAKDIAVHCFLDMIGETEQVILLRKYLRTLQIKGYITFKKE